MRGLAAVCAGLACFLGHQVYAQIDRESERVLASKFKSYQIIADEGGRPVTSNAKQASPHTLHFSLDGGATSVAIALEPNDIRDASYRAVVTTARGEVTRPRSLVKWFKGHVQGDDDALVRFTLDTDGPSGYFFQGDRQRFVEPLARHCPAPAGLLLVYDAADVISQEARCDANELEHYRATTLGRQATDTLSLLTSGLSLKLATEADFTYYSYFGENTNDHILGVINQVEGLYEKDFGVTFKVTYQHAFGIDDHDPYTSGDALTLLEQFRDYWNANHQEVNRNIAFLFNAVTGSALGRAYQAQACTDVSSSYGFFSYNDFAYEALVVAHEIGHTLNANHETPDDCQADPSLMCASTARNTPFKFSAIAQAAISDYLNSHACFNDPLEVSIHPIPARTDLIIETSSINFSTTLFDPLGRKIGTWISNSPTTTIPTTDIPGGFYILQIKTWNQTSTHRIEILPP